VHLDDSQGSMGRTVAPEVPNVGQFRWDVDADRWWWSDNMFRLYGYEPRAVQPDMDRFLAHKDPRDQARIDAVFTRCLTVGGPFSCYHRIIDAAGRHKTVVVVGFGERPPGRDKTTAMDGFMTDVSASIRRETSEALQAALQNRASIEQVKGAIRLVYGLGDEAAFAMLRAFSQVHNKKLAELVSNLLGAFADRSTAESVDREEFDRMLWDAAHTS
jgi:hypothetical protein